jgi:hypothetical protein
MLQISLKNLSIIFLDKNYKKISDNRFLFGDAWGSYDPFKKKELRQKELLEKLSTTKLELLNEIFSHSISCFFLVEKQENQIIIKTSPYFLDGLYFLEEKSRAKEKSSFFFSTNEKILHKRAQKLTLREDFLFPEFYGEPVSILSDKSFFKEIRKISAGRTFFLNKNGKTKSTFYLFDHFKNFEEVSFDEEINKQRLFEAFDKTARFLGDANKNRPIYLFLSDGIDSTSIFLSLLHAKVKFTAINVIDYTLVSGILDKLKEITANNDLVNFVHIQCSELPAKLTETKIKYYAKNHFRAHNFHVPLYAAINYFEEKNIENPLLLTGNGFDTIYHIRKAGSSMDVGISFYHAHIKYVPKMFYRNYRFIKLLSKRKFSWILKKIRDKNIPYDPMNYVTSFVVGPDSLDGGFYPFTMPNKGPEISGKEFKKFFYDVRKAETTDEIVSYFSKNNEKWTSENINLFCGAAMTINHSGLPLPLRDDSKNTLPTVIEVGYLPTISNLFIKSKICSYKDIFKIKRALFSFANTHLKKYGHTYENIAKTGKKTGYGLEYSLIKIFLRKIKILQLIHKANLFIRKIAKKILPKKTVQKIKARNQKYIPAVSCLNRKFPPEILSSLPSLQSKIKKDHLKKFIKHENYKIKGQLTTDYFGTKMEPTLYFSYYLSSNNLIGKIKSEGKRCE